MVSLVAWNVRHTIPHTPVNLDSTLIRTTIFVIYTSEMKRSVHGNMIANLNG